MKRLFFMIALAVSLFGDRDGGPYIGVGYGQGGIEDKEKYYLFETKSAQSFLVYAGAYINRHLSVEIEYIDGLAYRSGGVEHIFEVIDVNTQAHYAFFENRLDFFAKFGAGQVLEGGKTGFGFVYALGSAYRVDEMFALKVGYDYVDFGIDTVGNDGSADVKVGIGYYFAAFEVQF